MLRVQTVLDILEYLANLSREFECNSEKVVTNKITTSFKNSDDGSGNGLLKVVASGLWPRYFNTNRFLSEVMKQCDMVINIYCIDRSIDMEMHCIPEYDSMRKTYTLQIINDVDRFAANYSQCTIITIKTKDTCIKNSWNILSDSVKTLSAVHPEIIMDLILPKTAKNLNEEANSDCKTIAKSIADMLTMSQNDDFRGQCFDLLQVTNSRGAELRMQEKIFLITKSSNNLHLESRDISEQDENRDFLQSSAQSSLSIDLDFFDQV